MSPPRSATSRLDRLGQAVTAPAVPTQPFTSFRDDHRKDTAQQLSSISPVALLSRSLPLLPHLPREEWGWPEKPLPAQTRQDSAAQRMFWPQHPFASHQSCLWGPHHLAHLQTNTGSGYVFSSHSFCRQAQKQKQKQKSLPPPPTSAGVLKPSESCTSESLLPAHCIVSANGKPPRRPAPRCLSTDLKRPGSHADTSRTRRHFHGASVSSQNCNVTLVLRGRVLPSLHLIHCAFPPDAHDALIVLLYSTSSLT